MEDGMKKASAQRRPVSRWRKLDRYWCYVFIAPAVVSYVLFTAWPMAASWYYSFFDWIGLGAPSEFVGLGNFIEAARNPYFWQAFLHTFQYMIGLVALNLPLTLIMAVVLNNKRLKGAAFYRVLYFLPVVTTTAIIGIVMTYIFSPFNGALNIALIKIGLLDKPVHWLGQAATAMLTVVVVAVWKGFGVNMLYWLAGLQSIPEELYEAAKVDGATGVQAFWFVTLPLLKPVGTVITLLTITGALQVFDLMKVMTNGGPFSATETVSLFIYRYAFGQQSRIGFASAAGIFFGVAAMIVAGLQSVLVQRANAERVGRQRVQPTAAIEPVAGRPPTGV